MVCMLTHIVHSDCFVVQQTAKHNPTILSVLNAEPLQLNVFDIKDTLNRERERESESVRKKDFKD